MKLPNDIPIMVLSFGGSILLVDSYINSSSAYTSKSDILFEIVWLYFKYKVIRLLYLGENRNLAAYGQTTMRTQEQSFDRK